MMSKGKSTKRKSTCSQRAVTQAAQAQLGLPGERGSSNRTRYEQPRHKNAETVEQREQRLAKREALTLRAFQMAYENHHQRKSS
jgi:hypothetical protein